MPGRRELCLLVVLFLSLSCLSLKGHAGDGFQAIDPDELKMTSEPNAPGAPAIILYRQVDRDDSGYASHERHYVRIKILTEEGRKYADVEIPFLKYQGASVSGIKARTIKPDGSVVNFDGKVFEKSIVKARGLKYIAKTFTLPDVQVGGIIEYSYNQDFAEHMLYDSAWVLSEELFTKNAKFSLKPYVSSDGFNNYGLRFNWQYLPPGTDKPREDGKDKIIRLDAKNIPAFVVEDYMPPENELKARVDFIYSEDSIKDPETFWKKTGKKLNDQAESFVGKRKAMEEAVSQIVSPGDPPEVKLQKIYDRVQKIRNTSYEVSRTTQELKRDNMKEVANVEELWKRGYGNGVQLTRLFLGLVRAAGFEAHEVWVSDRSTYFFNAKSLRSDKLNTNVVLVKVNGKELYFDPGAAFTPFGLLEWQETGVQGLRLDKDGGAFVRTNLPDSSVSRVEHTAKLTLTESGTLEGKLTITFTGLEALQRRVWEHNEDDVQRKKFLESEAQEYIPVASEIELTNKPDWNSSSPNLVAEYNLKIPGWVSGAGRRAFFPMGVFGGEEKHLFDHAERVHPIYFEFPFARVDDVTIDLPPGWQIDSLPQAKDQPGQVVSYSMKAENEKGTLHLTRKLSVDAMLINTSSYAALREFFQRVRTGDEDQIILQPIAASAGK